MRGEGCFIVTADGRRYLDAAGGAAVVTIGHGVESVARAMAEQAERLAYVHSSQFESAPAAELARRLLALAPKSFRNGRVYLTSGGSEATETAIKLCRQYFLERGETKRIRIVSRKQSYHGTTLGALAVSGNVARREPFAPLLNEWGHIPPCYCYRCPMGLHYPECNVDCADELDRLLRRENPETVAAFIVEPLSGATLGAVPPPNGYLERIAAICREHGILLIADEVMTGMGRTGKTFRRRSLESRAGCDSRRQRRRQRLRAARRPAGKSAHRRNHRARLRHFSSRIHLRRASRLGGRRRGGSRLHRAK